MCVSYLKATAASLKLGAVGQQIIFSGQNEGLAYRVNALGTMCTYLSLFQANGFFPALLFY